MATHAPVMLNRNVAPTSIANGSGIDWMMEVESDIRGFTTAGVYDILAIRTGPHAVSSIFPTA